MQRRVSRFNAGDYYSKTPGSIQKLLHKLDLPPLQDRRKQLRLIFFYRVVEGLVPAIPPHKFVTQQRPSRQIRSTRNTHYITQNIVEQYTRNNNRCYTIKPCRTDQYRNSFFHRTVIDWNHLDNSTVNADSITTFKRLVSEQVASSHQ